MATMSARTTLPLRAFCGSYNAICVGKPSHAYSGGGSHCVRLLKESQRVCRLVRLTYSDGSGPAMLL